MAMSNYDMLAFDNSARPCNGIFNYKGTTVSVYKNWLYVANKKMWVEKQHFIYPTIAQVTGGGCILLGGVEIISEFNEEQGATLFLCKGGYGRSLRRMCGIGCYGFRNTLKIYIEKMRLNPEYDWHGGSEDGKEIVERFKTKEEGGGLETLFVPEEFVISFENAWEGVNQHTYDAFLKFLELQVKDYSLDQSYLDKIKSATPLRANQGDLFFANALNLPKEGTPVGESNTPMIAHMIGAMKSDFEESTSYEVGDKISTPDGEIVITSREENTDGTGS